MQKHTIEVRVGRDEDDRWWVMLIVDANDEEPLWCGPYENQDAADALIRATISALSASFSMTGPLAALMYSVLPSTLSPP
jgi:hypothetical protein